MAKVLDFHVMDDIKDQIFGVGVKGQILDTKKWNRDILTSWLAVHIEGYSRTIGLLTGVMGITPR